MSSVEYDESREERIEMEIIVDAYNEEEQAMGWYYYLDGKLNFPFKAKWINRKGQSEEVEVLEMSPEDDCGKDMFVEVLYREGEAEDVFSVPLYEIEAIDADPETQEAIADWHYWVERGNEL
jgi:hypothetical protein